MRRGGCSRRTRSLMLPMAVISRIVSDSELLKHTLIGCSMKRRQGHAGDMREVLWLQRPRGGV